MAQRPFEDLARNLVKLHPETVSNAAELAKKSRPRRKPMRVTVRETAVTTTTVDPRVMETALGLAGGDHRRLQILPDGAVLVLNHPRTDKPQPNR